MSFEEWFGAKKDRRVKLDQPQGAKTKPGVEGIILISVERGLNKVV
jgi:hypothetical protein